MAFVYFKTCVFLFAFFLLQILSVELSDGMVLLGLLVRSFRGRGKGRGRWRWWINLLLCCTVLAGNHY